VGQIAARVARARAMRACDVERQLERERFSLLQGAMGPRPAPRDPPRAREWERFLPAAPLSKTFY